MVAALRVPGLRRRAPILAILLPARVDSSAGEDRLVARRPWAGTRRDAPAASRTAVAVALRANTGLRLLSGFLTMFMAFLLRDEPIPGWEDKPALLLGLVIGAAGLGSTIGIALGSVLRRINPQVTVVLALLADAAVAVLVALFYGAADRGAARPDRRARPVAGQAVARRDDPARRPRARAGPARSPAPRRCSSCPGWSAASSASRCRWTPQLGLGVAAAILVAWSVWTLSAVRRGEPAARRVS